MTALQVQRIEGKFIPERVFWSLPERRGTYWLDCPPSKGGLSAMGAAPAFTMRWSRAAGLTTEPALDWLPAELDPFEALRRVLPLHKVPPDTPKRFLADYANIGFVGYELGNLIEPTVTDRLSTHSVPDFYWAFYDEAFVFDARTEAAWKITIDCPLWKAVGVEPRRIGGRWPLFEPDTSYLTRRWSDFNVESRIRPGAGGSTVNLVPDMTRTEYVAAVARVIEYIRAGDIFQANLSQRFTAPQPLPAAELYLRLRNVSPAPHAAYLSLGAADGPAVLSASPELFLHVSDDGLVTTKPIKGTRPRGKTPEEDERLRVELRDSIKDQAELTMIVDLERNDLGRVCRYGSVKVIEPRVIESFPNVHHGVATVQGRLRPGMDRIDLLRATFPGGSITGAPKVRAMQIIRELERSPRQVYTGSIGRFGMNGGMDLNIAIRTLLAADGQVSFGVGGGIVADSDPESEYEETLHKAAGMIRALEG